MYIYFSGMYIYMYVYTCIYLHTHTNTPTPTHEKEDHTMKNSLISINKIMSELYIVLIFAMNRLKLLL